MKQGALRPLLSDRARRPGIHVTALFEGEKPSTKASLAALRAIVEIARLSSSFERGNEPTALGSCATFRGSRVLWADQRRTTSWTPMTSFTQAGPESFLGTKEEHQVSTIEAISS